MARCHLARTAADVATDIYMFHKAKPSWTHFVLEGTDDSKLYGQFVNHSRCRPVPAGNKETAFDVLERLNKYASNGRLRGYLALVDGDFDCALNKQRSDANLIYTDAHNAECLIFRDANVQSLVIECGLSPVEMPPDFLVRIEMEARKLGELRLINAQHNLYLNFADLEFEEFFDASSIKIDLEQLVSVLSRVSHPRVISNAEIVEYRKKFPRQMMRWHGVNGHDLMELVANYLWFKTGNPTITEQRVASILRLMFTFTQFSKTHTYRDLRAWEAKNSPYVLFDDQIPRPVAA